MLREATAEASRDIMVEDRITKRHRHVFAVSPAIRAMEALQRLDLPRRACRLEPGAVGAG
ncbi:hypothetical protein [Methylobacterium terricola]|uniref:hypothetical protein n=1 Tax=Methylobacterium terricola TaxID=2583531 RepID=UPI0014867DAD|nr:hypothetical protein [Methylobacterium terricola]